MYPPPKKFFINAQTSLLPSPPAQETFPSVVRGQEGQFICFHLAPKCHRPCSSNLNAIVRVLANWTIPGDGYKLAEGSYPPWTHPLSWEAKFPLSDAQGHVTWPISDAFLSGLSVLDFKFSKGSQTWFCNCYRFVGWIFLVCFLCKASAAWCLTNEKWLPKRLQPPFKAKPSHFTIDEGDLSLLLKITHFNRRQVLVIWQSYRMSCWL